jgi:hypothetical protein
VEAGTEGDVVVVEAIGIELDFGACGASAEEVDGAAFADHVDGPLPGEGGGDGFNGDVDAAALRSEGADCGDGVGIFGELHDFGGAESACGYYLLIALNNGDDFEASELREMHEH